MPAFADACATQSFDLGQTEGDFGLSNRDDGRLAVDTLMQQAQRQIDIFTHDLEPALYDRREVIEALTRFALRHRRARVRLLTCEVDRAVKYGHQAIELFRRLSSYIEIRRAHENDRDNNESFLLVDKYGLMHRHLASRPEGIVSFKAPLEVRRLRASFDELWERSAPVTEFRRLHL